jgi:RHS repeat-associated protein
MTRADARVGPTLYTYDARGALLTRHLPNNSCTYYAYDAAGRLAKLEDRWDDGAPIQTFELARDPNGNITRSLREDASCWYYAYDGLQRLTAADWKDAGGATLYAFEYAYDKVGNRTHIVANGLGTYYSYNAANELTLEETPDASETIYYIYDGRGNQIQRQVLGGQTLYFDYNSRNLVSGISNTDPSFTPNYFEYNALGQRIKKTDSTGTTRYLWDGLNILLELDGSGNLTRRYTHGYTPIEGVSTLIAVEGPIQCPCFYHFDQVGGVRHLTDPYHNTIKSYSYEPFGRILAQCGTAPNDFVFPADTAKLPGFDELRLGYFRGYTPCQGRWASRDQLGGWNRWAFANGNPLSRVDPNTLEPQDNRWGETEADIGELRRRAQELHERAQALRQASQAMQQRLTAYKFRVLFRSFVAQLELLSRPFVKPVVELHEAMGQRQDTPRREEPKAHTYVIQGAKVLPTPIPHAFLVVPEWDSKCCKVVRWRAYSMAIWSPDYVSVWSGIRFVLNFGAGLVYAQGIVTDVDWPDDCEPQEYVLKIEGTCKDHQALLRLLEKEARGESSVYYSLLGGRQCWTWAVARACYHVPRTGGAGGGPQPPDLVRPGPGLPHDPSGPYTGPDVPPGAQDPTEGWQQYYTGMQ